MDWIPALSTTSLLAIALWLSRKIIATRLTNAVKHEYDKEIEALRAKLRKSDESFKAELKAKESQIEALRGGTLSSMVNKQSVLYQRQIAAIEQLWNAVTALAPAKLASATMVSIKFDTASKRAANDPKVRDFFKIVGDNFDIQKLQRGDASKTRPFISPLSWALYSAYQAIVVHAGMQLHMLKVGLDAGDILKTEELIKLVKVALPHQTNYIEKYGPSAFHYLLEELESELLLEFENVLNGVQPDKENLKKAAEVLQESKRLAETNTSSTDSEQFKKRA